MFYKLSFLFFGRMREGEPVNRRNYQRELERVLERESAAGQVPRLLLHACCAPCSSYVLEYLSEYFQITVLYFNPNIYPPEEYETRLLELNRFVGEMRFSHPVSVMAGDYDPQRFFDGVRGLEQEKEGGARCEVCFRMRLSETARLAAEGRFDYFTTTLSISPKKDAVLLNAIGEEEAARWGVAYLSSEFKKKGGFDRSLDLSEEHGLYRQDYCGCVFSRRRAE